ncbi:glutathione S-transferase family protein [Shewanella sp. Choline-02u-19]|uniref:glutathione S-transferase family protein n=1 Tax=unclassified Shewanella TaxID=196818 RepID=UPI000C3271D3|nr:MULTISPECIES: glutathione S-transferase family protein [unclassified Shewanella]PKH58175.1 glutathione S-transferase family protein [Shewanella sp. Bg11-22]PKI29562.1 glutathione S-transferase family protein [Shewanella sp. Choline-02u-19]
MDLYYHPLSRQSQKVLIALYEKQAHFYPHIINLADPYARRELQRIDASGHLPLLRIASGEVIPDASIIVEYLDTNIEQGTQLIPALTKDALQVRLYDRLSDTRLDTVIDHWLAAKHQKLSNQIKVKQLENELLTTLDSLDRRLATYHWLCGDSFSLADCATIPCLLTLETDFKLLDYEHLGRYWIQATLRGAVNQVQEEVALTLARTS